MSTLPSLVVFSHLRWNFVYQRPQHLLSRLTKYYNIIFIEETLYTDGKSYLEIIPSESNIKVVRLHTNTTHAQEFHDDQLPELEKLIYQLQREERLENCIVWFYTPMALPLLSYLCPDAVIYDCMDELAAFKNAPRQLSQRESALLKVANLVFTGGPSLYRAKCNRHPDVYCFPSSVDLYHFSQTREKIPQDQNLASLSHPRLGFYGVLDERLDLSLIDELANLRPEWSLILVGPVVKIDPALLPRKPNIHYLGCKSYDELPKILAS